MHFRAYALAGQLRCTDASSLTQLTCLSRRILRVYFGSLSSGVHCTFLFLSSPLFPLFLPPFFSLAGHLVGFIFMGKVFRNTFRMLKLDERKGRLVVEQDFHGNFQVNVTSFFASFSGVLDWIVLILVWFERSLHSAPVSGHKLSITVKTDDVTSSRNVWTSMGGYGRLRGKWVNKSFI